MEQKPWERYKPNPLYNGRKERDGFVGPPLSNGIAVCVAVKLDEGGAKIRDTKDITDTTLSFNKTEWSAFIQAVKDGLYDV